MQHVKRVVYSVAAVISLDTVYSHALPRDRMTSETARSTTSASETTVSEVTSYEEGMTVIVVLSVLVLLTTLFTLCSLLVKAADHQQHSEDSQQHNVHHDTLLFAASDSFLHQHTTD